MTHNVEFTKQVLKNLWDRKNLKIDWLEFETEMVAILTSDMPDDLKLRSTKELLDAVTRRGHFDNKDYLNVRKCWIRDCNNPPSEGDHEGLCKSCFDREYLFRVLK